MIRIKSRIKIARGFLLVYLATFCLELLLPLKSYALTSGPTQPEVQAFEPAGTTDMVNTFSGSFTYNVPLFELPGPNGGYPFNMAYHSGITMDDEASWVGLGWSLNPGVINRNMQALPDDFKGDKIKTELDIKDNWTVSTGFNLSFPELWSFDIGKGLDGVLGTDDDVSSGGGGMSFGLSMRYNSYRGFGASHSIGLDLGGKKNSSLLSGGAGLGISMDSDDGAGLNLDATLGGRTAKTGGSNLSGNVGLGISSRTGLKNLTLGFDLSQNKEGEMLAKLNGKKARGDCAEYKKSIISGSGNISFSNGAFSPQASMPMKGFDLSLNFRVGGDAVGVFMYAGFNTAFSMEKLKNKTKESEAYGYMYLQDAVGKGDNENPGAMLDVNREKDGMLTRNTPNLAAPRLTYDVYSVVGQGMMNMFRPYRNDVGESFDEYTKSSSTGGGLGVELGLGQPMHIGINADIHHSESWSGKWKKNNNADRDFMGPETNSDFENVYFRSIGEHTAEDTTRMTNMIGSDDAIKLDLAGTRNAPQLTNNFSDKKGMPVAVMGNTNRKALPRKPRANPVVPLRNDQLERLREYDISYYPSSVLSSTSAATYKAATKQALGRESRSGYAGSHNIGHHIGGITAVNNDGMRYVYGIPAYNNKHVDATFSTEHVSYCDQNLTMDADEGGNVDYKIYGTDNYKKRTQMPPYAHSYLLTSILGTDYIDVDNNGPSENDFGYWIKFNYVKASDGFKWRAPYEHNKASHHGGYECDHYDDKASYMYGEKEIWYLATAETKTHIAVFLMSERHDGQGALAEAGNGSTTGTKAKSYKLDKIELYLKKDFDGSSPKPIQMTHFKYDYSLCGNVPNNDAGTETVDGININAAKGKLTLKKVYFTYENSTKGKLSPYQFDYGKIGETVSNPEYDPDKYDRWGQYKSGGTDCDRMVSPYVDQDLDPEIRTSNVTAWNLTNVHMPSGADINVSYESNDYAYVQDKTAMQMYKIESLFQPANPGLIYNQRDFDIDDDTHRRVYFKLTNPIATSLTEDEKKKELSKYLDNTGQIYYKLHAYMRKGDDDAFKEYISGYADISTIGADEACIDPGNAGEYRWAYIVLSKATKGNVKKLPYHPFTFHILQSLKANLPHFAFRDGDAIANQAPQGAEGILEIVKAMCSAFGSMKELFVGYYKEKTGRNHQWASRIVIGESFIRLNNSIKKKYGGGVRVKSIAIHDNWNSTTGEASSSYGQHYDYTAEENGMTISSGVATYEPAIGGEENALRYAKKYPQKISIMSENNLFYEYPINESLYPAPSVGYSKVTVTSLNTKRILAQETTGTGYGSTGITENYFYTVKDYPVITSETYLFPEKNSSSMKYLKLPIPLPGLGSLSWDMLAASQGYVIQLNDMHGKPKKILNYALDGQGKKSNSAVSAVEYFYFDELKQFTKPGSSELITYRILQNNVPVLIDDPDPADMTRAKIETRSVGVDYEMFTDQRQSHSFNAGGGISFNIELLYVIPMPFPWPNINYSENDLRVAVTNKVIHRSGILRKTVATDGQSVVTTENRCFDQYTGAPLLTTVNNNFDDVVWAYNIPAHLKYDNMGPAYKNIGLRLGVPCGNLNTTATDNEYEITDFASCQHLVPGDELIMGGGRKAIIQTATATSAKFLLIDDPGAPALTTAGESCTEGFSHEMYLVRSGRRNQLNVDAGKIVALKDPTKGREIDPCVQKRYIPLNSESGCDFEVYGGGTIPAGLLDLIQAAATAAGDANNAFIPFSNEIFEDFPVIALSNAIAAGYIGIQKEDNVITILNINGNNCSWLLYEKMCNIEHSIPFMSFSSEYLPTSIDTSSYHCVDSGVSVPTHVNGYTLVGADDRHMLYQKPYDCFCNEVFAPVMAYDSTEEPDTTVIIDSVINASANVYTDKWSNEFNDARFVNDDSSLAALRLRKLNPFLNGESGVWRNWMNFAYHTDRRQSSEVVKTRVDGTYRMGLFNWEQPLLVHCDSNWVKVNEVTKYNAYNHEVENKDALDIYSAALYSFRGKLPVAVGVNTKYKEFGYEGFEEYQADGDYHQYNNASSNIDILTHTRDVNIIDGYCDPDPLILFAQGLSIISGTTLSHIYTPQQNDIPIGVSLIDVVVHEDVGFVPNGSGITNVSTTHTLTHFNIHNGRSIFTVSPPVNPLGVSSVWKFVGHIEIPRCNNISESITVSNTAITGSEISDTKAHTGRRSVKISEPALFKQYQLKPEYNKPYVFSAWVSRDGSAANVSTYKQNNVNASDNCSIEVIELDENDNPIGTIARLEPSGNMISKWQKIEGEFRLSNPAAKSIALKFYPGEIGGDAEPAYFDDVRVFPNDGNMKSYVYSNTNYRLAATLDDNNYATFFYYDEEGNLYLTKQETEKGIFTIQEAKTNMPH